ncbi:MAG: non-homologous end-joining DNA ligase, partial [Ignavibacteria bacterium]|nr:non-homologous end-joining DNA ligase [Ignavibacteria bacterium]
FYFKLHSRGIEGEFRIYHTKNKDYLLERVDQPVHNWIQSEISPMLALQKKTLPLSDEYIYEIKWDGIRVNINVDEEHIKIYTRGGLDVTKRFPELTDIEKSFRASCGVLDGEIVCLDEKGKPVFKDVIYRMQRKSEGEIERALRKYPAYCYLFDCIYLDGKSLTSEPLIRRREWLEDLIKKDTSYRLSETFEDGKTLLDAVKQHELEGIIAKRKESQYQPGRRSDDWIKIKIRNTADAVIIGYTEGKGDRSAYFGALHLGEFTDEGLTYRGKVGTGFDSNMMKEISSVLKKVKKIKKPVKNKLPDDKMSVWINPELWCEIQYASVTEDGAFREPVFLKLIKAG